MKTTGLTSARGAAHSLQKESRSAFHVDFDEPGTRKGAGVYQIVECRRCAW
jgi:hypothetical protein